MASLTPDASSASSNASTLAKSRPRGHGTVPKLGDGIVDGHGGTPLTLGWMLRHLRKAISLLVRQPGKILGFACRHPKKFLRLRRVASVPSHSTQAKGPAGADELRRDVMALLTRLDLEFFEVTGPGRIGHMAGEVDLWLREVALRGQSGKKQILVMDEDQTANSHFFLYCKDRFDAVISRCTWQWLKQAVPEAESRYHMEYDYFHAFDESASCYAIYRDWADRPALFQLTEDDKQHLAATKREWGMKDDDWFVCFHNRERGYSPSDDDHHDYRNASIEDYIPAMQEVVRQGGWVLRMGDPAMTPLPPMERVIDYAHSTYRSPRLDVELSAAARCIIGCSSGLPIMSSAFGVPIVMVNLAPMSIQALTQHDIGMPKLYFSEKHGRLLRFDEVFPNPMSNFRFTHLYREAQVRLIDNEAEDIVEVTREILDRVAGTCVYSEEDDRLQRLYSGLFRPGHYGSDSAARTSRAFLRKHCALLEAV